MKTWNSIKEYFTYTVKEQRGIFMLSTLLLILILIRISTPHLMGRKPYDFSGFEEQFRLLASMISDSVAKDTVKEHDLVQKKVPYVHQGTLEKRYGYGSGQGLRETPQVVEINTADSTALVRLPGIGPVLARRIIRYRESLGGYYAVDQLKEIYGMDTVALRRINSFLQVDGKAIRKMDLNAATFKELLRHPYLEYEHVKLIVHYRDNHHPVDSLEQLYEIKGLDPDLVRRLRPYLTIGSQNP
ncbi:MAG TPA: helix-hairpin-helix domain-containing protein [Bacteroidales bacterium]|nr:helix-hairpin-helix domain-containing protein [Bacteroidales bacterium]HNS47337.1 helix-hairpin-helix domain-containing protein [Bacteroidales bacterium]